MKNFGHCVWVVTLLASASFASDGPLPPGWARAGDSSWSVRPSSACGEGGISLVAPSSKPDGWATAMQAFEAGLYRGKRVKLSAKIATAKASKVGLWMRVEGSDAQQVFGFDNMQTRPIEGTTPCTSYEVVLDVPLKAETIATGVVAAAGAIDLSQLRLEEVSTSVPTTDLLASGASLGAPGLHPEEKPNELADALGKLDGAWFNESVVEDGTMRLYRRNPSRWSDRTGDRSVTVLGDTLRIKLGAMTGDLTVRREGDVLIIEGPWGLQKKFNASIRLSPSALDMTWGFYERHLVREESPQVEAGCFRYRQYKNTNQSPSDTAYVCGQARSAVAPAVQTVVGLLLSGFHRAPQGHAPGVSIGLNEAPALPRP